MSKAEPTAAISRATANGVLVVIHKKEISVLRVFCTRKTMSRMVSRAAAMRATQALPVRVRGTRPDRPAWGWDIGVGMICSAGAEVPMSEGGGAAVAGGWPLGAVRVREKRDMTDHLLPRLLPEGLAPQEWDVVTTG